MGGIHVKKFKHLLLMLLIVSLAASLLGGCGGGESSKEGDKASTSANEQGSVAASSEEGSGDPVDKFGELKLKVLGNVKVGSKAPVEDVLTPIWRAKTKVIPEIISIPEGQDKLNWVQMQIVAGTLPDIYAENNGISHDATTKPVLKKEGYLREIKLEELEKYMPRTAKRFEKWGFSLKDWYNANLDPEDGKLWFVPVAPNPNISKELRGSRFAAGKGGTNTYFLWFRDDILKKIFPDVKTEKELEQLYVQKNGALTYEEVFDVPIKNREDLFDYCMKVREMNLKVDGKPVIPIHPFYSGEDISSLMWSNYSMAGFWWLDYADRPMDPGAGKLSYFAATPAWKEYVRWMNKAFSAGLMGKEIFIQKADQKDAKIKNGEYAVFQWWLPVNDARSLSKNENRGYGYRMVPSFMQDLKTEYQDNTLAVYELKADYGAKGINPKRVKEEDIPQILNWIDWNCSEEAAELKAWGPPEFSTGEGENRRFKPEYKAVEEYLLTGKRGEKDGPYYGIYRQFYNWNESWNHEVYGLTEAGEWEYPWAPQYVYPMSSDNFDSGTVTFEIQKTYLKSIQKSVLLAPYDAEINAVRREIEVLEQEWSKILQVSGFGCDAGKLATVKAITGKTDDFEKNYSAYEKLLTDELKAHLEKQKPVMFKFYEMRNKFLNPLE